MPLPRNKKALNAKTGKLKAKAKAAEDKPVASTTPSGSPPAPARAPAPTLSENNPTAYAVEDQRSACTVEKNPPPWRQQAENLSSRSEISASGAADGPPCAKSLFISFDSEPSTEVDERSKDKDDAASTTSDGTVSTILIQRPSDGNTPKTLNSIIAGQRAAVLVLNTQDTNIFSLGADIFAEGKKTSTDDKKAGGDKKDGKEGEGSEPAAKESSYVTLVANKKWKAPDMSLYTIQAKTRETIESIESSVNAARYCQQEIEKCYAKRMANPEQKDECMRVAEQYQTRKIKSFENALLRVNKALLLLDSVGGPAAQKRLNQLSDYLRSQLLGGDVPDPSTFENNGYMDNFLKCTIEAAAEYWDETDKILGRCPYSVFAKYMEDYPFPPRESDVIFPKVIYVPDPKGGPKPGIVFDLAGLGVSGEVGYMIDLDDPEDGTYVQGEGTGFRFVKAHLVPERSWIPYCLDLNKRGPIAPLKPAPPRYLGVEYSDDEDTASTTAGPNTRASRARRDSTYRTSLGLSTDPPTPKITRATPIVVGITIRCARQILTDEDIMENNMIRYDDPYVGMEEKRKEMEERERQKEKNNQPVAREAKVVGGVRRKGRGRR